MSDGLTIVNGPFNLHQPQHSIGNDAWFHTAQVVPFKDGTFPNTAPEVKGWMPQAESAGDPFDGKGSM